MTVAEAIEISGVEALRDDSVHPPKLQFGDPEHIAARDTLRIKTDLDAVGGAYYFYGSTLGELIEMHRELVPRERAA